MTAKKSNWFFSFLTDAKVINKNFSIDSSISSSLGSSADVTNCNELNVPFKKFCFLFSYSRVTANKYRKRVWFRVVHGWSSCKVVDFIGNCDFFIWTNHRWSSLTQRCFIDDFHHRWWSSCLQLWSTVLIWIDDHRWSSMISDHRWQVIDDHNVATMIIDERSMTALMHRWCTPWGIWSSCHHRSNL